MLLLLLAKIRCISVRIWFSAFCCSHNGFVGTLHFVNVCVCVYMCICVVWVVCWHSPLCDCLCASCVNTFLSG